MRLGRRPQALLQRFDLADLVIKLAADDGTTLLLVLVELPELLLYVLGHLPLP